MNGESQDDESDRDHAQEGQEPVGQSMKSLVTRGRQKKNVDQSPMAPLCIGENQNKIVPLTAGTVQYCLLRTYYPQLRACQNDSGVC